MVDTKPELLFLSLAEVKDVIFRHPAPQTV